MDYQKLLDDLDDWGMVQPRAAKAIREQQQEIQRLRTELDALKKQEPVAWREFDGEGGYDYFCYTDSEHEYAERYRQLDPKYAGWIELLYAAPMPSRDGEIERLQGINAELLEALKVIASHWPYWASQMNVKQIDKDAIALVRAAIEKTRGEE